MLMLAVHTQGKKVLTLSKRGECFFDEPTLDEQLDCMRKLSKHVAH